MAAPRYLTPLELAVLALPPTLQPQELGPVRTSLVTKTGAGSGALQVRGGAFDAHVVRAEVVLGGELGVATFRYWTDGATWGDATLTTGAEQELLHTAADDLTGGADTGLRVVFSAGGAAPSFQPGDRWDFTTKPVQVMVSAILAASADAKSLISGPEGGGQYTGDLQNLDTGLKQDVAVLARLIVMEKRGLDPGSADGKLYIGSAQRARARLIEVARKERFPLVQEGGPVRRSPTVELGQDRGGISRAHRGGCR